MKENNYNSVTLAFFSGTGCTKYVVNCFEQQFVELGVEVKTIDVSCNDSHDPSLFTSDLLMIFSPVYAFRLTDSIEKWIRALPDSANIPVVIISVSGGGEISPNTACRVTAKRLLRKRNYQVIYEKMIVMPSNFVIATEEKLATDLINILPYKVTNIITDLFSGEVTLTIPKVQDRLFSILGRLEHWGAKLFGASIHATHDCTKCGLCVQHCPKRNILITNNKVKFGFHCMFCMRCIYHCPTNALSPRILKFVVLKDGFSINKVIKLAKQPQKNDYQIKNSFLWDGVLDYLKK